MVATREPPALPLEPSTPIRRPTRRSSVCPRERTRRAGAQTAMLSTAAARARRAPPTRPPALMLRPGRQARPTMLRARSGAVPARRPADPKQAVRPRALPTTGVVPPAERAGLPARLAMRAQEEAARPQAAAGVVRRPGEAAEAARPRVVEAGRWAAGQPPEHLGHPTLETDLRGTARLSTSASLPATQAPAHPTKARAEPSPTSAAPPEPVPPRADPSSGWRQAAEATARR